MAIDKTIAVIFKRGFRTYFKKRKSVGFIATFSKRGLSPTHINAPKNIKKHGYIANL